MKKLFLISWIVFLGISLFCAGTTQAKEKVVLKFMTGHTGGTWYPLGLAIAKIVKSAHPDITISVEPGGGSSNNIGVNNNYAQLGLTMSVSAGDAWNGKPPFKAKLRNIRKLLTFYPQWAQYITQKNSGIETIYDLKGKSIVPLPRGYSSEQIARLVLDVYGLSYNDMANVHFVNIAQGVELLRDRHADAILDTGTVPQAVYEEFSITRGIHILEISGKERDEILRRNPGLIKLILPANSYTGVTRDIETIGSQLMMIVNKNVPDVVVAKVTRAIIENKKSLISVAKPIANIREKSMAAEGGIIYHDGAVKYFKSRSWR